MNNDESFGNALIRALHEAKIFVKSKTWADHRFVWIALSAVGIKISILDQDQEIKDALKELKNE